MFILQSSDIRSFPFQEAATMNRESLEVWAKDVVRLTSYNSWMLPQLLGYLGTFRCTRNQDGSYDTMSLLNDNIDRDNPWDVGLWRVITQLKRSGLVKAQISTPKYSTLVPLILAGVKESKGIPYSKWTTEGLAKALGSELFEAATAKPPTLSRDRLIEIRDEGLITKSGKTMGIRKKVTSTWALTGIDGTELTGLPKLTVSMLTQIWVAHPTLRNSLMILDPNDWDNMPEPLIPGELLDIPVTTMKYVSNDNAVEALW